MRPRGTFTYSNVSAIKERKKRHAAWKRFVAKQDSPVSVNPEDYPIAFYNMDLMVYQMDDHAGLWIESTDTGQSLVAAYDATMRRLSLFRKLSVDEAELKIDYFVYTCKVREVYECPF